MNDLDQNQTGNCQTEKAGIEFQQLSKKQDEQTLIAKLMPHKGHTVWELNKQTGEIKPAEYESQITPLWEGDKKPAVKIVMKSGCAYVSALNKKSALKRAEAGKGSAGIRVEFIR